MLVMDCDPRLADSPLVNMESFRLTKQPHISPHDF